MISFSLQHIGPFRLPLAATMLLIIALTTCPSVQAESGSAKVLPAKLADILGAQDTFSYQRENRPDPFLPFIREKVVEQETATPNEVIEELTGLRKFEPGQLTLVAILFAGNQAKAMVQDPVGKGYIIAPGTKIGRSGIIEDIVPNAVIIRQTTRTWDRKKLYKRVQMVLRKEGEK